MLFYSKHVILRTFPATMSSTFIQPPRSPSPDVELVGELVDTSALGKHTDVVLVSIHRPGEIQPSRSPSPDVELVDSSGLGKHTDVIFVDVHIPEDLMNPFLWGDVLPLELKQLIFARLPLPQIKNLRLLSKEWMRSIDTAESLFRQVCAQASTPMFALIVPGDIDGTFHVHAFDPRLRNRWHVVKYTAPVNRQSVTICACDGGLVCFLFRTSMVREGAQVYLSVWNPLTGDEKELPVLDSLKRSRATSVMVQLCVDHHTKRYKVTVVIMDVTTVVSGYHGVIYRYDSGARLWSTVEETSHGDILGYAYCCKALIASHSCQAIRGHWQYNFTQRKVWFYRRNTDNIVCHAYSDYQYFRLWKAKNRHAYSILEEHFCHQARRYLKAEKHHDCSPFEGFPIAEQKINLYSCKGFLVVCVSPCLWLYDLSTCKWRDLPALPQNRRFHEGDVMCELQWNVAP